MRKITLLKLKLRRPWENSVGILELNLDTYIHSGQNIIDVRPGIARVIPKMNE